MSPDSGGASAGTEDRASDARVIEAALTELHARTLAAAQDTGSLADELYPIHFAAGVLFADGQVRILRTAQHRDLASLVMCG
jgi:hypothetical protein